MLITSSPPMETGCQGPPACSVSPGGEGGDGRSQFPEGAPWAHERRVTSGAVPASQKEAAGSVWPCLCFSFAENARKVFPRRASVSPSIKWAWHGPRCRTHPALSPSHLAHPAQPQALVSEPLAGRALASPWRPCRPWHGGFGEDAGGPPWALAQPRSPGLACSLGP